jgi:hypothetical protein
MDAVGLLNEAVKNNQLPGDPLNSWGEAEAYFRDGVGQLCYWDETTNGANGEPTEYLFEASDIPRLSVALYCLQPHFFFPYYFYPQFYVLQHIFDEFGIFMPPVPPKYNHDARFSYYFELCHSLYDFRQRYGSLPDHLAGKSGDPAWRHRRDVLPCPAQLCAFVLAHSPFRRG